MNQVTVAEGIVHSYAFPGSKHRSLDGFTLSVAAGEFVAVLGINGSGKTTFAKHLNVLLELQEGTLSAVGMEGFERSSPHLLSGGQKQRIAIAGVLASDPAILICDEITAMLDPVK